MGVLGDVLRHPDEFLPLWRMALAAKRACKLPDNPGLAFCYDMLNNVSRSFAVVIQQLPNPLRDAVCIFYLVLRGLDTVEDDMALTNDFKLPNLLSFHKHIYERGFSMQCGYKHYKVLMEKFSIVNDVFLSLDPGFQAVIADITRRMGEGMAEFIVKDVMTLDDYDKYCHYVAGLVGIGLSQLFGSSGLESDAMSKQHGLSNHMGLLLQKTNIIRDYLEDIVEEPAPRMFWPKEIWGQYGKTLEDFKSPGNRQAAVRCLNHMIMDALRHVPYCLQYMQQLHHPMVFRFCAIPQIMAMGTLAMCYNNGAVFEGVVKMRRGQTARVFDSCANMLDLQTWFLQFLDVLEAKVKLEVDRSDPTLDQVQKAVAANKELCTAGLKEWNEQHPSAAAVALTRDLVLVAAAAVYAYYAYGLGSGALPELLRPHQWLLSEYEQLHKVLAALLLLMALGTAVLSKR